MTEPFDWDFAGWEQNRRRQHLEFQALPLRQKLLIVEQLGEVAEHFAARRRARGLPVASRSRLAGGETPRS